MTTTAEVSKMEARILALLAKAEGTDNEHERDAFNRKAEELMVKLGIVEAELRAKGSGTKAAPEKIVTDTMFFPDRFGRARVKLAFAVALNLGGLRAWKVNPIGKKTEAQYFTMVGYQGDVKRARQLIESLMNQMDFATKVWWKDQPLKVAIREKRAVERDGWFARRAYMFGFAYGVGERIRDVYGKAVEETKGTSTELAIIDRQTAVDSWVESHVELRDGKSVKTNALAQSAGIRDGRKANVGTGSVGSGSKKAVAR